MDRQFKFTLDSQPSLMEFVLKAFAVHTFQYSRPDGGMNFHCGPDNHIGDVIYLHYFLQLLTSGASSCVFLFVHFALADGRINDVQGSA
jgi:hypothetical protein